MKQKNCTKRALCMSILSMLLCCSMLVGTTFAWFTDSVTSGKNKIVAGNLDVELEYKLATVDASGSVSAAGEWKKVETDTNLFSSAAGVEEKGLWEPGHTEVVYLRVRNAGTLALKYNLSVTAFGDEDGTVAEKEYTSVEIGINGKNKPFKLSEHIVFYTVDGEKTYESRDKLWIKDNEEEEKALGQLNNLFGSEAVVLVPESKKDAEHPSEKIFTLIAYMPTWVGNESNQLTSAREAEGEPTVYFGLNLTATQTPYENDSFGDNYDENCDKGTEPSQPFLVDSGENLNKAIQALKEGTWGSNTIRLDGNVAESGTVTIPEGMETTIDLNGNDLEFHLSDNSDGFIINNTQLTVRNSGEEGSFIFESKSSYSVPFVVTGGKDTSLTLENVTVKSETTGGNGLIYAEGSSITDKVQVNLKEGARLVQTSKAYTGGAAGIHAENADVTIGSGSEILISQDQFNNQCAGVDTMGSDIHMNGGIITVHSFGINYSSSGAGIVLDGGSTLDMSAGTITLTGNREMYGVLICDGDANMSGGTINVEVKEIFNNVNPAAFYLDIDWKNDDARANLKMTGGTLNIFTTSEDDKGASFENGGYAFYFGGNLGNNLKASVTVSGQAIINITYDSNAHMYNYLENDNEGRFTDNRTIG